MRSVIHLDADAFFASVEQAADPRLRGRPIAVGGEKRGIIASASYEARKFGIYTPMPTVMARRLCPKLILLPGDFEKYELFSRLMFSYAYDFTPDVEIGSIDEGYADLTGARKPAVAIAETIRNAIRQALKLSVSEGVATNKLVSQIASKLRKPAAFQCVPAGQEAVFLSPLANKWLPGVGPKLAGQLNAAGLAHVGQIAHTPVEMLGFLTGRMAPQLRNFALGIDERPVVPVRAPAKSYGEQETFAADTTNEPFLEATLCRMADKLMAKVREDGKSIRTLTVKVRYNDMDEEQASESLFEPTDVETDIYGKTSALLRRAWNRRVSLRLVSLKLSNVYEGRFSAGLGLDVSARNHDAQQRLVDMVDGLRQKYGRGVLMRGHDFVLRMTPKVEPRANDERMSNNEIRTTAGRQVKKLVGASSFTRHSSYVPLNVHSHYSFLDSTLSPTAIVELAKRHEMPAIALTDSGNLHGAVEFTQAATRAGIKPILGVELRVGADKRLFLYVESAQGYHNLCRLLTRHAQQAANGGEASVAAAQRRPLRLEQLNGLTDGLAALSDDTRLAEMFPRRFYVIPASRDLPPDFPAAACPPIHYATPDDRQKYDILQSIRTLTLLRQAHPEKRSGSRFHFRAPTEMATLCREHPDWLRHTQEIAERCNFTLPCGGKPQFPAYKTPDGSAPSDFLQRLVLDGLWRHYGARTLVRSNSQTPASPVRSTDSSSMLLRTKVRAPAASMYARLEMQVMEELAIISEVGYEEYFLITWDFLQDCKKRGIEWITRGSAADSLVCYCLGISSVCPIRFDLYFRRFLNEERMALHKLPDIDIDFAHDERDEVVKLILDKYSHGPEQSAMVGGFSTFQARSAFAEVAKVLGVSEREVRKFTDHFPWSFGGGWIPDEHTPSGGAGLIELLRASPENSELPFDEEPYRTALQMAEFLDGMPRYPKMHPCGLVLSHQPMHELTPTFISNKGLPTAHFDMDAVEAIGLVKMDILAQGGLAVMRDVKQMLNPKTPDLDALEPWTDPTVWDLISSGNARAVHHIESPAMTSLCRQCNVREIDGLIAIVSVIRPGAANEGKKLSFTRRYQRLEPISYPHPSLEACLRSTYGLVVYEEHILQICEAFAGLSPGRADVLRRALNKQRRAVIQEIRGEFFASALARGHSPEKTAEVWELAAGFAGYAFCKAHSTAYGVEAYQSAWLKLHYPAEFMAAVLTNGKGFYDPLVYVLECHRLGIPLLPPSVNEPGPAFTVVPKSEIRKSNSHTNFGFRPSDFGFTIRVPLTRIKGLTERTTDAILEARKRGPFESLADFFLRVQPLSEEMESLIQAGAFDEFGKPRTTQYWEAKALALRNSVSTPSSSSRQPWLIPPGNLDRLPSVPLAEPTRLDRLRAEEQLFGYAVSGHPLELYPDIAWDTYCSIARLGEHVGQEIVTCGLVVEQRVHHQITGEPMKFLTIADWTGMVETELFAKTYKSYGLNTVRYRVLEITARVEPFDNGRGFTLRVMCAGKPRTCLSP